MPATKPDSKADLFTAAPLPVAPLDDQQRLACLRLIRSENVGPVTFRELINRYGGATQALDALPELGRRGGRGRAIRLCDSATAQRELEQAQKAGATPIFTIEPGYPRNLAALDVPPPLIYVKGRTSLLQEPSVAVVGPRQASAAGRKLARLFAAALGEAGLVVVSGLARGIDGVAHETALPTGTIAVLAGGVDKIYPPEHDELYARISDTGCIVSEMPCGFTPRGSDFPRRNRIISGMSLGVLVVEAAKRSGTLHTARRAAEQGREVFAIPGHPLDPRAEGTNYLLKEGATLVTEPADIISALKPLTAQGDRTFREVAPDTTTLEAFAPEPLPEIAESDRDRVLAVLGPHPVELDEIARATHLSIRAIRAILIELDLAGRIERHGAALVSRIND
ncbi:DNA processing protein DprA [Candidatus Filomicrobium marinum]|uniref:DNA processing protein DprA n=1 Tax=Candidatus Filomicrobium marinum TaxID=1608628 RepID=A0A0D6JBH1_9HYPH|nr:MULTISPECIES: DNA-processing protein DprA [Filomicrobium]MCV0368584.1 DNA-processing protein DprA [Filomicrobium sp.]CFX01347.1 DNA processing protein DprA [Candidatus Filomicrobium marinum]CPR15428.1 DNA processing protein DprA [Candidatus Filomicrobium marinum]